MALTVSDCILAIYNGSEILRLNDSNRHIRDEHRVAQKYLVCELFELNFDELYRFYRD
jgi:hypothetical protein